MTPGLEAAVVKLALDAAGSEAPMSRADVASDLTAFLDDSAEGRAILARFKDNRIDRRVIQRMVDASKDAETCPTVMMDSLRYKWVTYGNIKAYFDDLFAAAVNHGMADWNPVYNEALDDGDQPFDPLDKESWVIDWNAGALSKVMGMDELGATMKLGGSSSSMRASDSHRIMPVDALASVNEAQKAVAERVRVLRRIKEISSDSTHFTLAVPALFDGQKCPIMVIYKSTSAECPAAWKPVPGSSMAKYFDFRVNGKQVPWMWEVSPHGGMTRELFLKLTKHIVVPCIARPDPHAADGRNLPSMCVHDGAHDHNDASARQLMLEENVGGHQNPPNTTSKTQFHDAAEDGFSTVQTKHLPEAKRFVHRRLKQLGISRGLTFADLPAVLYEMSKKCFSQKGTVDGVAAVGINPASRAPLAHPEVWATKPSADDEVPAGNQVLDLERLTFHLDQDKLLSTSPLADDALTDQEKHVIADKLAHELAGAACGSSKFWRHATTDPRMVYVQAVYQWSVQYRKNQDVQRAAATSTSRTLLRQRREQTYVSEAPRAAHDLKKELASGSPKYDNLTVAAMQALLVVVYHKTPTAVNSANNKSKPVLIAWLRAEHMERQHGALDAYYAGLSEEMIEVLAKPKTKKNTAVAQAPPAAPPPPPDMPEHARLPWSDAREEEYLGALEHLQTAPAFWPASAKPPWATSQFPRQRAIFEIVLHITHSIKGCSVAGGWPRDVLLRACCARDVDCVVDASSTDDAVEQFREIASQLHLKVYPTRNNGKAVCVDVIGQRNPNPTRNTWWGPVAVGVDFVSASLVKATGVDATASNLKISKAANGSVVVGTKADVPGVTLAMCIKHVKDTQFIFLLNPDADGAQRRVERYLKDPDGWQCLNSIPPFLQAGLDKQHKLRIKPPVGEPYDLDWWSGAGGAGGVGTGPATA